MGRPIYFTIVNESFDTTLKKVVEELFPRYKGDEFIKFQECLMEKIGSDPIAFAKDYNIFSKNSGKIKEKLLRFADLHHGYLYKIRGKKVYKD